MSQKRNTVGRILFGIFLAIVLLLLLGFGLLWLNFGRFVTAGRSIQKLEDNLYAMEIKGDYGLDEFLETGGADTDTKVGQFVASYLSHGLYAYQGSLARTPFGCSTLCVRNQDGNVLFGRNYDWEESTALILHTVPKNGYESVSACCVDFLGFGENYRPDGSVLERAEALAAVFVPLDGMNEKGLMVTDLMAGGTEKADQQTDKPDLTTTTALRLLLDRAATVDEAVELLGQYDMHSSLDFAHHFAIADASGKSVAVEYINNEMVVTETALLTNHYLAPQKGENGGKQSHLRYDALKKRIGKTMEKEEVAAALESVAQKNYPRTDGTIRKTVWSWVYSPNEQAAEFFFNEGFDFSYKVSLNSKDKWIRK
ncbi:MAG TPA: choloylglycine hydrolase [Ruminococcaceae bacterium]|nr:choloylglycine hydrolase [Oscillospiraceae bacterium]